MAIKAQERGAEAATARRTAVEEPKPRKRNRTSARRAGAKFEASTAQTLSICLQDDSIHREHLHGAKDRGDTAKVVINRHLVTVSCKDTSSVQLGSWWRDVLRMIVHHLGSTVGVIVHKRHGASDPLEQWVTTTVGDFLAIATGQPRSHFEDLIANRREETQPTRKRNAQ